MKRRYDPDQQHKQRCEDIDAEFREEEWDRKGPPYSAWSNVDIYSQAIALEIMEKRTRKRDADYSKTHRTIIYPMSRRFTPSRMR